MRLLTLSLVLFASNAFASPVTFSFTGEVTQVYIASGYGPNQQVLTTDPNEYVAWDGVTIQNGDSNILGALTFDSDISHAGGPSGPWPSDFNLQWLVTTEGIVFDKAPGLFHSPSSFDNDGTGVHVFTESLPSATSTSPFSDWTYVNFDFNFIDGGFNGGTFRFESQGIVHGVISGTIDRAFVAVPEPPIFSLLLLGLPLVMLRKRKRGKVCI